MRALGLLTLLLAGCGKIAPPATPTMTADKAQALVPAPPDADPAADLERIGDAHRDLTGRMQAELSHFDKLMADWKSTMTAAVVDAEDDAQRADLTKQDAEFRATDERLRRDLHEVYDPILEDLERRLVDAATRVKIEVDRLDGK